MLTGIIFGFVTAVTLGINYLLTAVVTRRFGVLRSTAVTLTLALLVMVAWAILIDVPLEIDADHVILLVFLGSCVGGTFLCGYMALRLGPVSVVSPIGALSGAMTVVYSFWLLGERPGAVQWAGIPIAVLGAVLASVVIERGTKIRLVTWGPIFAMIGVLVGSISNAGLKIPIREGVDSSLTVITQRVFTVAVVLLVFVMFSRAAEQRRRRGASRFEASDQVRINWRTGWLLGLVGLIDGVSFISFGYGLAYAPAWLIGIISQSGRVIAVVGGVMFFKERLHSLQWAGVGLVMVGVAMSIAG
ncbi:MAG: EamA family transporter [Acidimicrobiia bacterium]|nr:DMT family transporter [bacterium]MXX01576.1 EamA family transporter [Acidimicrobiia bacterium]MXX44916.1 EamA family transporter [Acidimicrobiia bacterium]MXY73568.1 EamA family transporter [Acidimicrobiia bacterium]MYA39094.1 EamA family transporter [Acidimicrobiia bacterium]